MQKWILVFLSLTSVARAGDVNVYMMAKAKFKNTTFTEIVFFDDPEIDTLEKCEKEKAYGLRGRWQYFGHRIKRYKGAALGVNYYCINTPLNISVWYDRNPYKYIYLTALNGRDISMQKQENYSACMKAMRKTQREETPALFCAKSNQKLADTQ